MLSAEYGSLVVDENTYVVVQEDGTCSAPAMGSRSGSKACADIGSYYHGQVIPVPMNRVSLLAFGAKEGDMRGGSDFRWKKVDKEIKWSEYTSSRLTCSTAVSDGIILAVPRDRYWPRMGVTSGSPLERVWMVRYMTSVLSVWEMRW